MAGEMTGLSRSFSIDLWHGSLEDQRHSGRCWIYASLNPLRQKLVERYRIDDFHFSTNYIYFYDQLEKSAAFLDRMIELRDVPLTDPELSHLLCEPIYSAGQWGYFAVLAQKYGLVPRPAMPDTTASEDGTALTRTLSQRLRVAARDIRSADDLTAAKAKGLTDIKTILRDALGTPPTRFNWDGKVYTPITFFQEYCGISFDAYVTLMHHPSARWPEGRTYHEEPDPDKRHPYLTMLSVNMETMKALTLRQLQDGEQVVIGCDIFHSESQAEGELSTEKYGAPALSKTDTIRYREIRACHVMSIDGAEPEDGRWRVLDSHGLETGPDGHYVMTDAWFDAYVLSAVIKKEYLTPALQEALAKPVTYMPKTERF